MIEKRFVMRYGKYIDNVENIEYDEKWESWKICELLNELHEENQSSKEFIEQLQEELILFKEAGANMGIDLNAQITALKQENEQLKQQLQSILKLIGEIENCTHDVKLIGDVE